MVDTGVLYVHFNQRKDYASTFGTEHFSKSKLVCYFDNDIKHMYVFGENISNIR